jgi:sugar lactone lactonase YvrE
MRSNIKSFRRSVMRLFSFPIGKHRWPVVLSVLMAVVLIWVSSAAASITFLLKWGTTGSNNGQFITPRGIATDSAGNVYVVDQNARGQKFDSSGTFLFAFSGPGSSTPGKFIAPAGAAVDSAGNIYVTDSDPDRTNDLVAKFNSSGAFVTSWGTRGTGNGQFFGCGGVAVDASSNVYVADPANHRIQKFTSTGTFITNWGSNGSGDGQFSGPQGVAVDSSGNVYVGDTGNNRIQKFNSSGTFITKWGSSGSGDGQFSGPIGVAVDSSGNVYVSDTGNGRIQKFSSTGTFLETFGSAGSGDGQFSGAQFLAVDASANIYVADTGNDRVQKLGSAPPVVANAGPDQTVECAGSLTSVTLDGTASTGSGTLSYTWKEGSTTLGTGATLSVSLPAGSHTITLTVSSSGGGSSDDTLVVNIVDTTSPVISISGANPLTVECHTSFTDPGATANDACAGSVAVTSSGVVDANTPGTYMITYSATDGTNSATAKRTVNVVDTTPPVITCPSNITVTLPPNSTATSAPVSFTVTAVDSCSSNVTVTTDHASGSSFPVGTTTVNATADDHNGNTSSCLFAITVRYNFTGFFSPVGNPPVLNSVNAGRAIPVKFSLSGNKGLNIFAPDSPSSGPITCDLSSPVADLQDTVTAGGSSLNYDPGADQYIYVWKTDASWAGTCRQLVVTLNDGSVHVANFRFR